MALLELWNVEAGYGRIQILHKVSLHVEAREVVSVIGPNGAGKSTTFKVIMGFIDHLGGDIRFDGTNILGSRPDQILARGLGYVPQGRIVFNQMTVRENLEMGGYVQRDREKLRESMEYVFSLFPRLAERQKQLAGTMSGGEQQMLAMGRALMTRPRMLMLDEPSLGLSPRFVDEVFDKIAALAREELTIMLVEQNAARSLEISDRGYVLELGRNRYEGSGHELLHNDEVRRMYLGG
ncbi:MAG: ABC transporter ATP-binding protein [Candidatus Lambdaproteobacteria bacterium]|nr:ABC transporter ATP-binding protein [Candidatus Lambdaproteobacteria bacterium]